MTEWTILPLSTDFALCKGESMEAILHSRTLAQRVAACLNACAGMADPAAKIAALRQALVDLARVVGPCVDFAEDEFEGCDPREWVVNARAAVDKVLGRRDE